MPQPIKDNDYNKRTIRAMLLRQQQRATMEFSSEWRATAKAAWIRKIDASVQVVSEAYVMDLERLLIDDRGSQEWKDIIQQVRVLTYATLDRLLQLKPELRQHAYDFEPQSLDQKAHKMLSSAAYRFGISLRQLEREFPANVRVVAESVRG